MTDSTKLISKLNSKISALTGKINALTQRQQELESALIGMIDQASCDTEFFTHTFMSCDEAAYKALDIEYGESVAAVYQRYELKWKENEVHK